VLYNTSIVSIKTKARGTGEPHTSMPQRLVERSINSELPKRPNRERNSWTDLPIFPTTMRSLAFCTGMAPGQNEGIAAFQPGGHSSANNAASNPCLFGSGVSEIGPSFCRTASRRKQIHQVLSSLTIFHRRPPRPVSKKGGPTTW
jgi:hypothetical protein